IGEIRLWRAKDGQLLLALQGHSKQIWSLTFNPESTRLISGSYDGLVKVWELRSGQCVSTLQGHSIWIRSLAMHPAGQLLATCSQHAVHSVAFSPDGELLVSGGQDARIMVWEASNGVRLSVLSEHTDMVQSVAFNAEGLLVSASFDRTIKLWKVGGGAGAAQ